MDYYGERIRCGKRNRTIGSDWDGHFIPVWRHKTQAWKKPSSTLSNLHWSNVKACTISILFGRLANTVSALHMVGSVQPKCRVVLIPLGSLRWDERGETHISNPTSLVEECQWVVTNWNDKILRFRVFPMEMQGMIKVVYIIYCQNPENNSRPNTVILSIILYAPIFFLASRWRERGSALWKL